MKRISLILISLFILVGCSKNGNNLKEDLVMEEKKVNISNDVNVNQEQKTTDTEIQPKADYIAENGYITASVQHPFPVRPGYPYVKVWVKALANSSAINCIVTKNSITGAKIEQFTVKPGNSVSKTIRDCPSGTYWISFASSGNMNGQFNIRVATDLSDLNN